MAVYVSRDPGKSIVARESMREYVRHDQANTPKLTGVIMDELHDAQSALQLVRELAESTPYVPDLNSGGSGDGPCFHCAAERSEPHADTCLWLRAKRMVE